MDILTSNEGSLLGNDMLRLAIVYVKQNIFAKMRIDFTVLSRKFTEEEVQ